jgi:hypothetical protein
MSGDDADDPCSHCGDPVSDALARTVRLSVDRAEIDSQRLYPACFAEWIGRYESEMQPDSEPDQPVVEEVDGEFIVD